MLELTGGEGADKGCECVGYQCHDHHGNEVPNFTMNNHVAPVRPTGQTGVVGVFVPSDPGGSDELIKEGKIAFDMGLFFMKGQSVGTGQADVKRYDRQLMRLIHLGKAKPSFIVSHHLHLDEAPDAYRRFDDRDQGWTKVVLKPAA